MTKQEKKILGEYMKVAKLNTIINLIIIVLVIVMLSIVGGMDKNISFLKQDSIETKTSTIKGAVVAIEEGTIDGWSSQEIKNRGILCDNMLDTDKEKYDVANDCIILNDYINENLK